VRCTSPENRSAPANSAGNSPQWRLPVSSQIQPVTTVPIPPPSKILPNSCLTYPFPCELTHNWGVTDLQIRGKLEQAA
jgi:hypothetical protein